MALSSTSVLWRDLTFATGADARYRILGIEGWEGLPPSRYDKQNRSRAHGSHPSPVWADERLPMVEGRCSSEEERDAILAELGRGFTYDGGEEELTVTLAGRTLTASAQLLRYDPVIVRETWGIGRFGWVAQWRCPDPLRYGPPLSASTGLPTSGGGLAYPLTYGLDYGAVGATGQIVLSNDGTADTPVVFTVTGSLPQGFEISAAGRRLTYPVPVASGEVLTIDTGAGTVLAQGTADRRSNLVVADWLQVPAGGSLTVQFTSLGGAFDAAASLSASWRSASW